MPPVILYRKLVKLLSKEGFVIIRQKGSHQRWGHSDGRKCTVPVHKQIAYGTFSSICEQIQESPQKIFEKL